jgi:hypothetical protein
VFASQQWPNQWAAGSAYPDFPVIGDPYTDAGEGNAKLDSVKLFVPDTTAPTITIASPAEGATFTQARPVPVTYSCVDPDVDGAQASGLAGCAGDVASGALLDTSTPGAHTFTVKATDAAGNLATLVRNYTVLTATNVNGDVGGSVPGTLALTLAPATFGTFTPGVTNDYSATATANVISSAANALLSVADPSSTATGHLVNGAFSLPSALQAKATSAAGTGNAPVDVGGSAAPTPLLTYSAPTSNDAVTIAFAQHVAATDGLRTGSYAKTLTFTLSTSTP